MAARLLLPALALLLTLVCLPGTAAAAPYLPPPGKIWNGVTAGFDVGDFQSRTGKHPAVWQHFVAWGGSYQYTLQNSRRAGSRLMLHISTSRGQNMPERISPGEIARGRGDGYLVRLTRDIAGLGAPAYIRLMGEMNNCNNPYAAYSCSGGRRDAAHSAASLKQAWKRTYLIMHGGDVGALNERLGALHLPPLQTRATELPVPQVAFVWAPMVGGAPNIAALRPQAYWPGRHWVDWVGTSLYSRFPNFSGLERFYDDFAAAGTSRSRSPSGRSGGADAPSFADHLFGWIGSHRKVRMVQYNQGAQAGGIFRLSNYPASARVIRRHLRSDRFVGYAPEQHR